MLCRACGVCCIAISISSPLPGLPDGKPAGVRCPHLSSDGKCGLFGRPERPTVCSSFPAIEDVCGSSAEDATDRIALLERLTQPLSNHHA